MLLSRRAADIVLGLHWKKVGTPCFVFLPEVLDCRLDQVAASFNPAEIFYSLKANPEPSILQVVCSKGFGADVSTTWELDAALNAGFTADRLSCVGPWKPDSFLSAALSIGVRRISFETINEAKTLFRHAPKTVELYARVLLEPSAVSAAENMTESDSPFGLYLDEVHELLSTPAARLDGVHLYRGSDFQDVASATESIDVLNDTGWSKLGGLQFGPGLGVSYHLERPDPDWRELTDLVRQKSLTLNLSYELGRYLVAHSVALLVTVQHVKKRAEKQVAILDGGITSFARTILTGARHPVVALNRPILDTAVDNIKLCGPTCTPLDVVNSRCYFDTVEEGDVLAVLSSGAYGVNLNLSGFLGYPRAPFCHARQFA